MFHVGLSILRVQHFQKRLTNFPSKLISPSFPTHPPTTSISIKPSVYISYSCVESQTYQRLLPPLNLLTLGRIQLNRGVKVKTQRPRKTVNTTDTVDKKNNVTMFRKDWETSVLRNESDGEVRL